MMEKYGICALSVVPVREKPSSKKEMVTQLLYGEIYSIIEQKKKWTKISNNFDNYSGWINNSQLTFIKQKDFYNIANRKPLYCLDFNGYIIDEKKQKTLIPIGGVISSCQELNSTFFGKSFNQKNKIINTSKKFINSPYLWGGRNQYGIDCSGFSQIVYMINGITIPRDASQQAKYGIKIDRDEIQAGNLAFFGDSKKKVTHVGILINDKKIIHAFGKIRIDNFTSMGIENIDSKKITHNLIEIRKY